MNDKILFRELLEDHQVAIRELMRWENYELNEVLINVTEKLKNDAILVLEKNYGRTFVYPDILDDFLSDVFVFFPVLMQELAITRLIDGYGVVKDDINTVQTIRNEELTNIVDQTANTLQDGTQNDITTLDTKNATTGTVSIVDDNSNIQTSKTTIENVSGTESTGMRNVSLAHNMPEQSLSGTGNFSKDQEGTPILNGSYVQQATEGFTTSNPINSKETSNQNINNTNTSNNNSLTTNNINVSNTGSNSRSLTNKNTDTSELLSNTTGNNKINETVTSTMTNKQYAYEVKAFLETAQTSVAFRNWINHFSWIEGII